MSSIDNRIVQMQFDNREFERNIAQSMKSVEEFEKTLNFNGAVQGFQNIDKAAQGLDLSPIVNAIENTKTGFNALETIAFTVFQRVTNAAIDAGKNMYNAIFGGGIKSGFQEYETQINAVQTILANTSHAGTTLEEVNNALDELNLYADLTIYNFTEMTRNIGTFTAAGVDLETSTAAIKGIANLAAVSGSTSEQASRAMYQLSQALASGRITLQDWNSVVNAGMGGKVFQDSLVETARAMGVVVDLSDGFRESMIEKKGTVRGKWITSDILLKTLQKFTGDMTEAELAAQGYSQTQIEAILKMGQTANDAATKVKTITQLFDTAKESVQSTWTQSWEYVIGDFEEAKELLTMISQAFESIIQPSGEARNRVLKFWHDSPYGRAAAIESIKNIWKALGDVINPVKLAFQEMFPSHLNTTLVTLTGKFRNFTKSLIPTEETTERIYDISKKVFSVIKNGLDIVGNFRTIVVSLVKGLNGIDILETDLPRNFHSFYGILYDVKLAITNVLKSLKSFGSKIGDLPGVKKLASEIKTIANAFVSLVKDSFFFWGTKLSNWNLFGQTESDFDGLLGVIDRVSAGIANFLHTLPDRMDRVVEFFKSIKLSKSDANNTESFFERVRNKIFGFLEEYNPKNLVEKAKNFFTNIFDGFTQGLEQTDWDKVKNVGVFATLIAVLIELAKNLHNSNKIFKSLADIPENIGNFFEELGKTTTKIGDLATSLKKAIMLSVTVHKITELAFALAALALSVAFLSTIPKEDLYRAVIVFGLIGVILALISKLNLPIREASSSSTTNIKLLGGVGEMAMLFFALAADIAIIMSAMKQLTVLNNLNSDAVTKSVWNIVGILVALAIFAGAIQTVALFASNMNSRNVNMGAVMRDIMGLILITSISLVIIGHAMKEIGSLKKYEWERAHKTVFDFLAVMVVIVGGVTALGAFGNGQGINSAGTALLKMAAAMVLISIAIGAMMVPMVIIGDIAAFNSDIIDDGFSVTMMMLAVLGGIVAVLTIVGKGIPTNMVAIGTAFILIAAALNLLTLPIIVLGVLSKMGMDISKSANILMGSILAIGALLIVMAYVSSKISSGTDNFALVANAVLKMAAAMLIIAGAMALLKFAGADWSQFGMLVGIIGVMAVVLGGLAYLLSSHTLAPTILQSFGVALIGLGIAFLGFGAGLYLVSAALPSLTDGLPAFSKALGVLLGVLEEHWPIVLLFTVAITALSIALIALIVKFAPQLGPVMTSIGNAIRTFGTNLSSLPTKTKAIIIASIVGAIAALGSMTPEMLEAIKMVVGKVFSYLSILAGTLVKGIVALIVVILFELSDAIIDNAEPLAAAIHDVVASLFYLLMELVRPLVDTPIAYIYAMWSTAINFIGDIIKSIWTQVTSFVSTIKQVFDKLISGDFEGAADTVKESILTFDNIKNVFESAKQAASEIPDEYSKYYEEASKKLESNWTATREAFQRIGDSASESSKAYAEAQTTLSGIENALLEDSEEYKDVATQAGDNIEEGNEALASGLSIEKVLSGDMDLAEYMGSLKETLGFELGDMQRMVSGESENFSDSYKEAFDPMGVVMGDDIDYTRETLSNGLTDMVEEADMAQYQLFTTGDNAAAGFGKGWSNKWSNVENIIERDINGIDPRVRELLGINFPISAKTLDGEFMILGLSVGAEKESPKMLNTFTDILSQISDVVDTDVDVTPRIAPVLDTTNLQNGISRIPGMLNNQSYRLGGINARLMDENKAYKEQLAKDSMYNDGNVINSIRQLHDTTADLASKMENMQVVMDSGALVGAMAPGMDRALGVRAVRKGRGN